MQKHYTILTVLLIGLLSMMYDVADLSGSGHHLLHARHGER